MPYRTIDHTGDTGIAVEAPSLEELFAEAARGFTDIITDTGKVAAKEDRVIDVSGNDREQLLVRFLSELLFLFDTEKFLCAKAAIEELTEKTLRARIAGERFDPGKHPAKTAVKAVTYHGLNIQPKDGGYAATIIVDL